MKRIAAIFLTLTALVGLLSVNALAGEAAGEALTGNDKVIYTFLKDCIEEVASGEASRTVFTMPVSQLDLAGSWSAADLGVEAIIQDGRLTAEATNALLGKLAFHAELVVDALLSDLPFGMFWYDKTVGMMDQVRLALQYQGSGHDLRIWFAETAYYTFVFDVAEEYAGWETYTIEGAGTFLVEVDPSKREAFRVDEALDAAARIVADNAGKSDYGKLLAYKTAICDLVDYNHTAAEDPNIHYGNPWEPVYVFDGDDSTKVVCEGYAKAFQYLCDLTDFAGDVQCYIVTGQMTGGTGAGGHMWNLVYMPDGQVYLVDVTNCDEGSTGYPAFLFLAGADMKGENNTDFTVEIPQHQLGGLTYQGGAISYTYDDVTRQLWADAGILDLAEEDCDPNALPEEELHTHQWGETRYLWSVDGCTAVQDCTGCGEQASEAVTFTVEDGKLQLSRVPDDLRILVCAYEGGRMTGSRLIAQPQGENDLVLTGRPLRVFFLNGEHLPLRNPLEIQ